MHVVLRFLASFCVFAMFMFIGLHEALCRLSIHGLEINEPPDVEVPPWVEDALLVDAARGPCSWAQVHSLPHSKVLMGMVLERTRPERCHIAM